MAVGFVNSASSGSQASVASFSIGTLGTSARAGIVFVCTHNSATDIITGVTWNSAAMSLVGMATDTDTEPGITKVYFLDNVTNGTITVSRTNNTVVTVGYAASISASSACIVSQFITRVSSTQTTNGDTSTTGTGASGEVSVDDNSPGTNSMRFAAAYTGAATPLGNGTNSTALQSLDSTALGSSFVRETTAGQGSRSVGFATGTTDDYAAVFVAVSEKKDTNPAPSAASLTLTGGTPTVQVGTTVSPTAASLTLTGATPAVATPRVSLPTAASLTLTGSTPAVATPVASLPTAASLTLTGSTPAVTAPAISLPTAASLTLTGSTPAVTAPAVSLPTAGALVLTGSTPEIGLTTGSAVTSEPTPASLVLSGATPTVSAAQTYVPDPAALTLTGGTPAVAKTDSIVSLPTAAALVLAGVVPNVTAPAEVLPGPLGLTLTGSTPTVATTTNVTVRPDAALLLLAGAVPAVSGASAAGGVGGRRGPSFITTLLDDDEVLSMLDFGDF